MEIWSTKKSAELYNIDAWGAGFFRVNDKGNVEVTPHGAGQPGIDLKELVQDLQERGMRTPLLVRFPDIVNARIKLLSTAFHNAFQTYNFKGQYRGVFPIKVNQQRFLVDEIVNFGRQYGLGLEAGSKPELLISLAMMDNPEALLICNGFKDPEYVETALLSQKLGRNTIIVLDRYSELDLVIRTAKSLGISPRIGFRAKLEAKGAGKWVESSGAKSKFGLTASEMVKGMDVLKAEGMCHCLELLHFHIGSQITALRAIKDSLTEASRIYVDLAEMGAGLKFLDVGGGLGVDYDGSQTNWENSINYTIQEYANDVVAHIAAACDAKGLPHPSIVTESGRALVAHHSVLVFDVLGTHCIKVNDLPPEAENEKQETIVELRSLYNTLTAKNLNEHMQDAFKLRDDGVSLFNLGHLNLKQRAVLEKLFWAFCTKALEIGEQVARKPEELAVVRRSLADSYYCNFSIFQSAPDTWAVDQLFPIMPIHRLKERPDRKAELLDLTCDSDGKIDRFIDIKDVKETLELHMPKEGETYHIGMFLIGAYQEILGDFHNLFGDTDAVHVSASASGYTIEHVVAGDSINEVLGYVEYDRHTLIRQVRGAVEKALSAKKISLEESRLLMRHYEDGLSRYTYLDPADLVNRSESAVDALKRITQRQEHGARLIGAGQASPGGNSALAAATFAAGGLSAKTPQ